MCKGQVWRIARLGAAVGLCAMLLAGCYLLPPEEVALVGPTIKPETVNYVTYEVTLGNIEDKVTAAGTFISSNVTDVYFTGDGGYLSQVNVKLGQAVKAGDLLVQLNTQELETQKTIQSYERKKAQLSLESLKANGASTYEIQIAEYELKKANADYSQVSEQLENASLYAPSDGLVGYIAPYNRGDYINAYVNMVRIVDPTQLHVVIDGTDAKNFSAGETVTVDYNGQTYQGTVTSGAYDGVVIQSGQDIELQSYIALTDFTPASTDLGQPVEVTLQRQYKENVIVIPVSLLTEYNDRSFVRLLVEGTVQEVDVETGIVTATQAEIVSGLSVGDQIIRN